MFIQSFPGDVARLEEKKSALSSCVSTRLNDALPLSVAARTLN